MSWLLVTATALLLSWGAQDAAAVPVLGVVDMGVDLAEDMAHPCYRNCSQHPAAKVCVYQFKAEYYTTMSKACYNCSSSTPSDCWRPHCVAADGVKKPVVTINRRLPGPSVQVCQGDEIVVDVNNQLMAETTTIHWHGLHMVGTPYMDGVPHVTQCPIQPATVFRYHFLADKPGTHYWHSHSGFQRADGLFGSLVVRSAADPLLPLYDVDDASHLLLVTDWLENLGMHKFVFHHHSEHDNKPYNILVNGRGFAHPPLVAEDKHPPLSAITVTKGLRHRIRTISNSIQNCPIEISVDGHSLLLVSKDGAPIESIAAESFVIYGGERWDFVLEANNTIGNYWIKFHGLLDCDDRFKSAHEVAVLRYAGASDSLPGPITAVTWNSTKQEGFQVNTLNQAPGTQHFKTAAEVHSKGDTTDYSGKPDHMFWIDFDFHPIDNEHFHHQKYYPFYGVPHKHRLYMPQMNYITLQFPHSPPLSQPEDVPEDVFCNATSLAHRDCTKEYCACVHVLEVERNSLVELVLVDKGLTYYANHPFHIHGHAFAVLGMGRLGHNTTLADVQQMEKNGLLMRNFDRPPIMDTVTVPDGGYTVIRFMATNPGYWLFHCHISFHIEAGMGLVFKVGDNSMVPPVPHGFPRCGHWQPQPQPALKNTIATWLQSHGEDDSAASFHMLPSVTGNSHGNNLTSYSYSHSSHCNKDSGASETMHARTTLIVLSAASIAVCLFMSRLFDL